MSRYYYYETGYEYNVFGADEHLCVYLYRGDARVGKWSWSTFLSWNWANSRAESRIRKLRATYGAMPLG